MLFSNSVLSDRDINKKLGKDIFIYPFKEENLKGSTYNLTASIYAWIIEDGKRKIIVDKDNNIIIPEGKTALIQTEESIYISKKLCGTYHSRVSLCNKGLGHIGTTLDPCYFGTSVIALHNNSDKPVNIKVGESIVSIMFYSMKTSADNLHDNFPFRKDLFDLEFSNFYEKNWNIPDKESVCDKCLNCENKEECKNRLIKNSKEILNSQKELLLKLEEWKKKKWRTNRNELIKQVKKYTLERDMEKNISRFSISAIIIGLIFIVSLCIIVYILKFNENEGIIGSLNAIITCIPPTVALVIGIKIRYLKKGEI